MDDVIHLNIGDMEFAGIVRRVDDFGRIAIPKILREMINNGKRNMEGVKMAVIPCKFDDEVMFILKKL